MPKAKAENITGSKQISAGECWLDGYLVNTASTFRLYHGTAAADLGHPFGGTITPPAVGSYALFGLHSTAGVYVQTGGETIDVTFLIREVD